MSENTKARPGEFDALEKARPDELIFTLLERDPCAPAAIIHWCELRRKRALEIREDDERRNELRQISEAEFIAMSMLERQKGQSADAPAPAAAATYSGLTVQRTAADEILPKLRAELAEADYHTANALELGRMALDGEVISEAALGHINDCARVIHGIALELSPHRAALMAEQELPLGRESTLRPGFYEDDAP